MRGFDITYIATEAQLCLVRALAHGEMSCDRLYVKMVEMGNRFNTAFFYFDVIESAVKDGLIRVRQYDQGDVWNSVVTLTSLGEKLLLMVESE